MIAHLRRRLFALFLLAAACMGIATAHAQTFGVYREMWTNLNASAGNNMSALTNTTFNTNWPSNPATSQIYANFESGTNIANLYGERWRAFVVPPTNGNYRFWIASDDSSQLFLSSDESPSNMALIGRVDVWTDPHQWTKEANQQSSLIALEAGRRYYLEARHQEGSGGDSFCVRWQLPNATIEEPMTATSAGGTRLIPCTSSNVLPGIFVQPTNTTVLEAGTAVFSLLVTNQGPVTYQWRSNGTNVPGANATKSVLTLNNVSASMYGWVYRCVVSNVSGSVTSSPATLIVTSDTTPPTLVSAGNSSLTNVIVRFSEAVEPASATNKLNYSIAPGVAISSAAMNDAQSVVLVTSLLTLNSNYTVTVNSVRDLAVAHNTIATNSQTNFTALAHGLEVRPAVGPFLNGQMPQAAPTISGNWSAVPTFTNLMFTNALGLAAMPGTQKLIVWEREGRVYSFTNTPSVGAKSLVLDISNQCQGWDDSGLLNIVFHPGFVTNRYMFVYYTWVTPGTVVGSPTVRPTEQVIGKYHDRLSRFTLDANGVAVPGSEVVFVDQTGDSVWHNGSGMFFHPVNGFLYYMDGDDERSPTQIINSKLFSGVFRIDVDMRGGTISHAIPRQPVNGTTANYFIPNDNPFVGQSNVLEEFYALGLRSPHRMSYDAISGRTFITDVGAGSREELDIIEPNDPPGLNFQWSVIEGLGGDLTPPYIGVNKRPVLDYSHSEGQAIIGGYVYRGTEFASDLGGKYIFGDNVTKKVWVLDESTTPVNKILLCVMPTGPGPNSGSDYTGLSSFGIDQANELYFCQMSSVGGNIYKLARTGPPPASQPFPPLISQTGAFADVPSLTPNDSLIPYTVNSPLWSDGALKRRWVSVPTNTFIHFTPTGEWSFPNGTVFVKNFDLPVDDTNTNILKRLETRFLVRDTNGAVYGITYKWRTNYTDADLVTNALTEDIVINTGSGTRTQQWFYPGPLDCLQCHTPGASHVLGVKTRQLNGNLTYPATGVTDNQLRAFNHISLFDVNLNEASIPGYDKLVNVTDTNAPITHRIRSYLDSNCAQCHRPGGVPAFWDGRFDTPLANQNIINGNVANSLGITGAKEVAPQDISKSIMYQRVNNLGIYKMPPLARNRIDTNAVTALAEWINGITLPTISPISDVTIPFNGSTGPIGFTVADPVYPVGSLAVTGSSGNTNLIPNANIVFGGSGSNRTVTVLAAPNQSGTTTITVTVDNGQAPATETFNVTVLGTLIAYYPFEGTALDASGNGNHGTTNGGVNYVAGKIGSSALNFNGTNGYVLIPRSVISDFTIALWLKTTAVGGGGQWWSGKGLVDGEVNGSSTDFGTTLVNNNFAFGVGNPDTTIVSTTAINDGNWHHVAATRVAGSGQIKAYVDGVLQATGTAATTDRVGPPSLRIGSLQTGTAAGYLAGTIDDVRIYSYALGDSEIAALAANTPPILSPISNRTVIAGATLTITNNAFDAEAPPQVLTYSLLNPPSGAGINSSNGIFAWRPTIAQSATTNVVSVRVADNGVPSQSATQNFLVAVTRPVQPQMAGASISSGKFNVLISGDAGPDYAVQASSNLLDWSTLLTTNSPALPFWFSDPGFGSNPRRFYRVQLGP